ncbi:Acetyltransferase (GNAT) domain-containing protein [Flavobacterium segetis]|uniref:Acetyltransferase (GNAT) domain-containing protein n=1 Tax=Flavobacterium segetis TaxID=271157 RepID=A0A1M5H1G9_9FLAO|nr:GNAT family N-acetyltransferase [Flavobacterium segetis]SHG09746.1 Acetyltransferase (GNAT) domain-containing protein [Flavobacterium segetis]
MQTIKKITALETFPVRHPVLRSGKSIESCHFDGDNLKSTVHYGLFILDSITGVISLFKTKNNLFPNQKQFQIRGMAVLQDYQKKGFGAKLILNAEKYCKEQNTDLIWFNARKEAIEFYEKMGFKTTGKPFEIKDVGEHTVMYKYCKTLL